jgi:hypothetical protein
VLCITTVVIYFTGTVPYLQKMGVPDGDAEKGKKVRINILLKSMLIRGKES